jgi:hypothetical protein
MWCLGRGLTWFGRLFGCFYAAARASPSGFPDEIHVIHSADSGIGRFLLRFAPFAVERYSHRAFSGPDPGFVPAIASDARDEVIIAYTPSGPGAFRPQFLRFSRDSEFRFPRRILTTGNALFANSTGQADVVYSGGNFHAVFAALNPFGGPDAAHVHIGLKGERILNYSGEFYSFSAPAAVPPSLANYRQKLISATVQIGEDSTVRVSTGTLARLGPARYGR